MGPLESASVRVSQGRGRGGGGTSRVVVEEREETPWLPVARSRAPVARSTAKSTANAIEYFLAVRERKGDRESTWYLNQLGTHRESGRPNACLRGARGGARGEMGSRNKKEERKKMNARSVCRIRVRRVQAGHPLCVF